jgi:hypothetical protein
MYNDTNKMFNLSIDFNEFAENIIEKDMYEHP